MLGLSAGTIRTIDDERTDRSFVERYDSRHPYPPFAGTSQEAHRILAEALVAPGFVVAGSPRSVHGTPDHCIAAFRARHIPVIVGSDRPYSMPPPERITGPFSLRTRSR